MGLFLRRWYGFSPAMERRSRSASTRAAGSRPQQPGAAQPGDHQTEAGEREPQPEAIAPRLELELDAVLARLDHIPQEVAVDSQCGVSSAIAIDADLPAVEIALGEHEQLARPDLGRDGDPPGAIRDQGGVARDPLGDPEGNLNECRGPEVDPLDVLAGDVLMRIAQTRRTRGRGSGTGSQWRGSDPTPRRTQSALPREVRGPSSS